MAPSLDTETVPSEPADNSDEENDAATAAEDALIFERLKRVDPNAYEFAKAKDIRLISRPKWSGAFEWTRTNFDLEERTDSSGTYFAFLYGPDLSKYQKLTFLIHIIRRDEGFKEWFEENKIVERKPSTISPAPGTPEYKDYQDQLKEQNYALMEELGATPEEISSRRWHEFGNDWLGPQGIVFELLNAAGAAWVTSSKRIIGFYPSETGELIVLRHEISSAPFDPPVKRTRTVFRGERASKSALVIFDNGLIAKGTNADLKAHLSRNLPDSYFIATSIRPAIAKGFAGRNGWLYVIRADNGIDVNAVLGPESPFPEQFEISIPGNIPASSIIGAFPMKNGKLNGAFIRNPKYEER
ncbi:enterotoxin A family protein [bacterium]|nr:enterotoxin A family protein [bacterium]